MVSFQQLVKAKANSVIHGYLWAIRRHAVPWTPRQRKDLDVTPAEDQEHVLLTDGSRKVSIYFFINCEASIFLFLKLTLKWSNWKSICHSLPWILQMQIWRSWRWWQTCQFRRKMWLFLFPWWILWWCTTLQNEWNWLHFV